MRRLNYPDSMCADIALAANGLYRAGMVVMSMWMKEQMRMPTNYSLGSQGALLCGKPYSNTALVQFKGTCLHLKSDTLQRDTLRSTYLAGFPANTM